MPIPFRSGPRSRPRSSTSAATAIVTSQISLRVVLDPAGLREVLRELAVALGDDPAVVVEQQRLAAGGALVEREDHAVTVRGLRVRGRP